MVRIFKAHVTLASSRPQLDFTLPVNKKNDWDLVDRILLGEVPVQRWPKVRIVADLKGEDAWDAYAVPGTLGLFSKRAIDAVPAGALEDFERLEARLNLLPYAFLKPVRRLPCLDLSRTQGRPVPSTSRLMTIEKWAFVPGSVRDPRVFCPAEFEELLATESVVQALQAAGCRGIDFQPLGTA